MKTNSIFTPGSRILITGASSGIGAALAKHLAGYKSTIILAARRVQELEKVARSVRDAGGTPLTVICDVADMESVGRAYEEIKGKTGAVDIAFLNAGTGDFTSVADFDAKKVKRVFEINLFGVVHWLGVLLPGMISEKRGIIAATSSLAAARGFIKSGPYNASKSAVSILMESLRPDAAKYGVQLTTIEPGFVKSEMTDKNDFPMPFMIGADTAAKVIAEKVARGDRVIRFPWQHSAATAVTRYMPEPLLYYISKLSADKLAKG